MSIDEPDLGTWYHVRDTLGCTRGTSIKQAAELIATGQRRATRRARRMARKLIAHGDGPPWPVINRAAGYRRPGGHYPL